ncbi:gamma-glutamyltransferase [Nocardia panacis]|uniref:gamma-glutamyltransferase n=1 Tax=Nocardia panacis TaxID=2340916 RepID=UPI00131598F0|nr:gamma-glutamyltransferase [Nocardia panacis]
MGSNEIDLSSASWGDGEYEHFMAAQTAVRDTAGTASGRNGAVTVAYGAYAARAGLEALKQGGNAIDAALTTALTQVALTAGAPISYFGIMSLVYYDAKSGSVRTMNAEWNTVAGETDPLSIPGSLDMSSPAGFGGTAVSGRTALVGGFMKGVESAHARYGKLPFESLFQPAIEVAENGTPVNDTVEMGYQLREADLARLPETKALLLKPDGSSYRQGETLRQPRLAETLRRIAAEGAGYMYGGPWGEKLIAAVQADGGKMTLEDLVKYEVLWSDPLVAEIGGGYSIATAPWPNAGGTALIEAQHLAAVSGLLDEPHWTESGKSLRKALEITRLAFLDYVPQESLAGLFPGVDFSPAARATRENAERLWESVRAGFPLPWQANAPRHSDDVVAIDAEGNIAAITHSINCVMWGKTAINIDGISIGDPGSYLQPAIAAVPPGERLPAPTETGVLFKHGVAVLGFASMGSGLHEKTFQSLINYMHFGMSVAEAVNKPDFFTPTFDADGAALAQFAADEYDHAVLDASGLPWNEAADEQTRFAGEGVFVAIERDPRTGVLHAASHNRNNSAAVAF